MKRFGSCIPSLLLVLGLVLSACAAPEAPAAAPEKPAAASPSPAAPQLTREQQLIEAAKKEGEVSFWVSTIPERDKLIRAFQARYPFLKLSIFDVTSPEVPIRLAQEAKAGRHTADVLLTGSQIEESRALGLLTEYAFPNAAGWPNQPAHKYYISLTVYGRLPTYNTNLVSPADVPRSWDDIKSPKWSGKTIMSINGREVALVWAYLWRDGDKLNWDRSFAFWGDVIRNTRPRIATGYTGPAERLAAGEFALMPEVPTATTLRLITLGAPIGAAPVGKVPFTPMGLALVKDAPHPNAARLFIDWLATPEGLLSYANPTMHQVLAPQLQGKATTNLMLNSLGVSVDLVPAEVFTTENVRRSSEFWVKALDIK